MLCEIDPGEVLRGVELVVYLAQHGDPLADPVDAFAGVRVGEVADLELEQARVHLMIVAHAVMDLATQRLLFGQRAFPPPPRLLPPRPVQHHAFPPNTPAAASV